MYSKTHLVIPSPNHTQLDWNEGGASPPPAVLTAITAFAQASGPFKARLFSPFRFLHHPNFLSFLLSRHAPITAADGAFLKWYPHLSGGEELRGELCDYTGCIPGRLWARARGYSLWISCNFRPPSIATYITPTRSENLMVTNGSDDALILICQAFLGHGKVVRAVCVCVCVCV